MGAYGHTRRLRAMDTHVERREPGHEVDDEPPALQDGCLVRRAVAMFHTGAFTCPAGHTTRRVQHGEERRHSAKVYPD